MPSTFSETVKWHCKQSKKSNEQIAKSCDLSVITLRRLKSGKQEIKLESIIKFAIGMKLTYPFVQDMLNKEGISLRKISIKNMMIKLIILLMEEKGIIEVYETLKENKQESILSVSKVFLKQKKWKKPDIALSGFWMLF